MMESFSEIVLTALEKAIQQNGQVRLIAKGAGSPGLFPSGGGKAKTDAVEKCFAMGLLEKTQEVEEGKGKSAKKATFVRITSQGIDVLFERKPVELRESILQAVAPEHAEAAEATMVRLARREIEAIQMELSKVLAKEELLFGHFHTLVTTRMNGLAETRANLERSLDKLQAAALRSKSTTESAPQATTLPTSEKRSRANSEEDLDFQREQSKQLVFAWEDASNPETKQALEDIMFNLGLEAMGERGSEVPFDGRIHQSQVAVEVGETVQVVDPGWQLTNSRGVYLLSKARTQKKAP